MATLGANVLTLADWAKRIDPDGSVPAIAEMLAERNDILTDMVWKEGNLETGHRAVIRTGLPSPVWRMLNQGIPPTKTTTAQIDFQTGMLEDWTEVDVDLAELNGNTREFRLSEAVGKIEAMGQEMAATLFYGNASTAPEEFTGLAVQYSSLSAQNGQNIINAGGSGSDNMSIWLIVWSPETVFGIFPKGSKAGLMHEDLGKVTVETTAGVAGNRMRAYQDHFQWKAGICVKDWRYAVRIANIDVSNLSGSSAADLIEQMIRATHRPTSLRAGRASWYMNRTAIQYLDIQRRNDVVSGGGLTFENVDGQLRYRFREIPIGIVDQLTETEAAVT